MKTLTYDGIPLVNYDESEPRDLYVTLCQDLTLEQLDFAIQSLAVLAYPEATEPMGFSMAISLNDEQRRDFYVLRGKVEDLIEDGQMLVEEAGTATGRGVFVSYTKPGSLDSTMYKLDEQAVRERQK